MSEAEYWDPVTESVFTVRGVGEVDLPGLLEAVRGIRSGRVIQVSS